VVVRQSAQAIPSDNQSSTEPSASDPVAALLATGGDVRLQIDPMTGLNRYGCSPWPRPWAVTFASSTASSISERGYAAAEIVHRRLVQGADPAAEAAMIRRRILAHYGILDAAPDIAPDHFARADFTLANFIPADDIGVILTPSGTDAALIVLAIALAADPSRTIVNVLMAPEETGSGVPLAVRGRHFADTTALGQAVAKGAPIDGFGISTELATVPLRHADGSVRPAAAIDADTERAVTEAIGRGCRVVLHMVDLSKTGLLAPSMAVVERLRARYPGALDVAVDACQARLGAVVVRDYLAAGYAVLLTGSKFYTGPPFAGAILLPPALKARLDDPACLPSGLGDYAGRFEWPDLPAATRLAPGMNLGLLLRWNAALAEMEAFAAVPDVGRCAILQVFGEAVRSGVESNPDLLLAEVPDLARGEGWDRLQTIFTILVLAPSPAPRRPLPVDRLALLYRWLNMDLSDVLPADMTARDRRLAALRCHIGQPVPLGPCGALRVSAGARLVSGEPSHAGLDRPARIAREIGDALAVLDKLSLLLRHLDRLEALDPQPGTDRPTD